MSEQLQAQILAHLKSAGYRPQRPRGLADAIDLPDDDEHFHAFRDALKDLMHAGRVLAGANGAIMLPTARSGDGGITGSYRHNKRGFGFVVPSDPSGHEDLFIPEGKNGGAMTGDVVRAKVTSKSHRDGKAMFSGQVTEVITRGQKRFVGTLSKLHGEWVVLPDGNMLTDPINCPDAGSRHIRPGTKVVVELTSYPGDNGPRAAGVISEVLGAEGEKDVDLKAVVVQFNLPGDFPEEVRAQARRATDSFDPDSERDRRVDITDQIVCTIDPNDAKDYDDAISLRHLPNGNWELGVHIADVSHFVPVGSPLDVEAKARGNSCYFPGRVIPMLPEILSNGVCSLQEGVPRFCKSAFIQYDAEAKPVGTKFANTIIHSRKRLRYVEAQAIIDGAKVVPHPSGDKTIKDYEPVVVKLLHDMDTLSKRIQKRRQAAGQINLTLPETELVLDEGGKVVDAVEEDHSFTHTLIEMFMVEANEAVARLLNHVGVPFLRRTHPEPAPETGERLRNFVQSVGIKLPKEVDRHVIQNLLASVKGKPEGFAVNLAVLKSLTRAEYSPKEVGHYALASQNYCHFTSPIRRYADLMIHRLLDSYFDARAKATKSGGGKAAVGKNPKAKLKLEQVPPADVLTDLGKQISFTERRADDAERELRQVKLLELLGQHVGEEFPGVITGITNFGVFVQLDKYLIDGLIRYENLLDDWWDVDDKTGVVRGQRSGVVIGVGDVCKVIVARVDPARRELDLAISELKGRRKTPNDIANTAAAANGRGKPAPNGPRGGGRTGDRGPQNRGGGGGGGGQRRSGPPPFKGGTGKPGPNKSGPPKSNYRRSEGLGEAPKPMGQPSDSGTYNGGGNRNGGGRPGQRGGRRR